MTIELQPLASNLPGHGQLRLEPWTDGADALEVCIQRNQGAPFLSAEGEWSTTQQWLQVSGARCEDSTLLLDIGPEWVDPLLASEFKVFRVFLRSHGGRAIPHPLKIAPEVLSSSAAGSTPSAVHGGQLQANTPPPAPEPEPAPAPPPPPPEPAVIEVPAEVQEPAEYAQDPIAAEPQEQPKRRSWLIWAIAAAIAILAVAAAGFFLLRPAGMKMQDPPAAPTPTAACSVGNMGKSEELALVQACIRDIKDSPALLEIIQQAKTNGHCTIAQRLYANRARAGDNLIAMAYAREYDPQFHKTNACFQQPEAATAAYWYQIVLDRDSANAEAKARLGALQQ